jgi:heme-degrading monooxygenase HmoA
MFIAMNQFRVAPDRCEEFEQRWRSRESYLGEVPGYLEFHLLRGPEENGARLYASHTTWRDEGAFLAWTGSEAFRKAHGQAGATAGTLLGPPRFVGWQVVL